MDVKAQIQHSRRNNNTNNRDLEASTPRLARPTVRTDALPGPLEDTMKALRFYAPEDVRLEDVPEPECGPGEVKLRVRNCSTCGTDVKIFHNGHQNLTPPRIIGHEIAGEVVEVGADVNGWSVGDRAQVIAA